MITKEQLINEVNSAKDEQSVTELVRKHLLHGLPFVFENE